MPRSRDTPHLDRVTREHASRRAREAEEGEIPTGSLPVDVQGLFLHHRLFCPRDVHWQGDNVSTGKEKDMSTSRLSTPFWQI